MLYIVYLCLMCYMASVSSASRKKVLGVFISVVCAFNLAVCIGELYAAMHRTTVILPLYIEIGMQEESGLNFVTLTRQHRNLSAQWNCLCFCLVIYLASLCRKKAVAHPVYPRGGGVLCRCCHQPLPHHDDHARRRGGDARDARGR